MARYYADQALGMLETIGMVPALEACDKMLKAAEVELLSYENVGSTLVTMFIKGDVAAVKSSIKAGAEAAEAIGKLTATDVIPRPIRPIGDVVSIYDGAITAAKAPSDFFNKCNEIINKVVH